MQTLGGLKETNEDLKDDSQCPDRNCSRVLSECVWLYHTVSWYV
jgi:hypothetical protein